MAKIERQKKKKRFYSPQDSGPGLMSHPWSLSRLGSPGWAVVGLRVWGGYARQWAPHRDRHELPFPSVWALSLQIQAGPPAAAPTIVPPKDGGASGLEELYKVPWALRLLMVWFPSPASLLSVTPPVDDTPFCRVLLQSGSVLGMEGKGEEVRRHKS